MKYAKILFYLSMILVCVESTPAPSEATMTKKSVSSLCHISKYKNMFSGKTVSVEGEIVKIEDYNKIYLVDSRCPNVQFALNFGNTTGQGDNFSELYDYLYYSKSSEAVGKIIHCRCTGRVGYVRQKLMGYMVSSPTIYVEKVDKAWLSN